MTLDRAETLYALTRVLSPEIIVETGVGAGISSGFILQAMEHNGKGSLYSIDLPPSGQLLADGIRYYVPAGKSSGWMIPETLKHRWHLILGDSREQLLPLLERLSTIDAFLHDSLHTVENMRWEYKTAWPFIRTGGLLLSDDINEAFVELCHEVGALPIHLNYLGGIVKR